MLGYYYEIIYNKGREHMVIDALFRKFEEGGSLFALSFPFLGWIKESCQEWTKIGTIVQIIERIQEDSNPLKCILGV